MKTRLDREIVVMPHIIAAYPEDDILCDVCRMVTDALKITGDDQRMQRLMRRHRLMLDQGAESGECRTIQSIYLIVEDKDALCLLSIAIDKSLQRLAHHSG